MVKRIELEDGTIIYKNENGFCHREDGPAVIYPNDSEWWYKNGLIHRRDGPAVIYPEGVFSWYLNGELYSFKEWLQVVNISDEEKMELVLRYG